MVVIYFPTIFQDVKMTDHLVNVKHMQIDIVKRVVIVATSQEVWKHPALIKMYDVAKDIKLSLNQITM